MEKWCREKGIIFALDEVQSSYGRTGKMWAMKWGNLTPDLVAVGKGIGNGIPTSAVGLALILLDKPSEFQRIMFVRCTDVIGDEIIVSDFVPAFGVVPEVTDILDVLAAVVDQHVVDGNNPMLGITSRAILLQPLQPKPVEFRHIPI